MTDQKEKIKNRFLERKNQLFFEYHKARRLYEMGERYLNQFPNWVISTKYVRLAYNQKLVVNNVDGVKTYTIEDLHQNHIRKSNNLLRIEKDLNLFMEYAKTFTFENILAVNSRMNLTRLRDGKGTSAVAFAVEYTFLKSRDVIKRHVRKETKSVLETEFYNWVKVTNHPQPKNKSLPTKLLNDLLEDDLEWEEFADKLYQYRINKDNKKGQK
jgi:hypothetical protein